MTAPAGPDADLDAWIADGRPEGARRDVLVEAYLPVVIRWARSYAGRLNHDWREILGAAFEGLLAALRTYDPAATGHGGRRASFVTHLRRRAAGAVLDYLRAEGGHVFGRRGLRAGVRFGHLGAMTDSEGEPYVVGDPQTERPWLALEARDELGAILPRLSPRERDAVLALARTDTNAGAAKVLGVSRTRVAQLLDHARRRLERDGKAA